MKKSIIIVLCIVFALVASYQILVFLSKQNYKKTISTALSIPVRNLKMKNYINELSTPGEGYTFMRLKVRPGIDIQSIPPLPEQEGWQTIPWNYTDIENPLPDSLSAIIYYFGHRHDLQKELSKLQEIYRTRKLRVGGYSRRWDRFLLILIDDSENMIYYIDSQS